MVVLDTNHISILERRGRDAIRLAERLSAIPDPDVYVTVISYEEQIRGWISAIGADKTSTGQVNLYSRLLSQLENYCNLSILPYTNEAATLFESLRKQLRRTSATDLKIAAITILNEATLLTQNERDFRNVPGLKIEDWTK